MNRYCINCKHYQPRVIKTTGDDIPMKCSAGNDTIMKDWFWDNGQMPLISKNIPELSCFESHEGEKILESMQSKMDEILERLNQIKYNIDIL